MNIGGGLYCVIVTGVISSADENDRHEVQKSQNPEKIFPETISFM